MEFADRFYRVNISKEEASVLAAHPAAQHVHKATGLKKSSEKNRVSLV